MHHCPLSKKQAIYQPGGPDGHIVFWRTATSLTGSLLINLCYCLCIGPSGRITEVCVCVGLDGFSVKHGDVL